MHGFNVHAPIQALAGAPPPSGAVNVVQEKLHLSSDNTQVIAYDLAVASGATLALLYTNASSTAVPTSVTDNINGAWTEAYQEAEQGAGRMVAGWYLTGSGSGAVTVTVVTDANTGAGINIFELTSSVLQAWSSSYTPITSAGALARTTPFDVLDGDNVLGNVAGNSNYGVNADPPQMSLVYDSGNRGYAWRGPLTAWVGDSAGETLPWVTSTNRNLAEGAMHFRSS